MREMKDSGVAWIGKIPHCWNTSKLKYLGQYINGYAFKPEEWGSKGVPIIRIQDLTGSNDNPNYFEGQIDKKYWVENGDILISWAATLDAFIWNKGNGWLNQHIFKAVPNRRIINYDFFFWMIKESMKNMNNDNKHGIFMQHVTLSVFNNFTIPMPPLAEQERIAAFLDAECAEIDTVLEKTRASIEEYKKLKQAVITQAVTKGIRGDRPMKDSGIEWIGDIPAEWDYTKAKNCVNIQNGSDPKTEGSIPVYGSGASSFKTCGEYKEGPSVLIGRKGATLHIPHYISTKFWNVDTAFNVYAKPNFDLKFYFYCACSFDYRFYISQTTLPSMTQTAYENMFLPLPSNDEQRVIASYLDNRCEEIDALIWKKQECLVEIENYKKSLIYEYVTGKKEVV